MGGDTDALPSGVVTFLFSDIEGSTGLLHRLGLGYKAQLQQYRDLLTEAFERHGGAPLGSEGDSLLFAFERVSGGLAAAVDGQLALGRHDWPEDAPVRARMGVHVGEVQRLGDGYVGLAIHLAARVCAAANGGQILTTESAHRLAPETPVLDLGKHSLKDVGEVRLLQVQHPELARAFPPLRVSGAQAGNLPPAQDRFIGRGSELAVARAALAESRLVTLTGPGGTGKTRLALELGRLSESDFGDGVWFVSLASASDLDRVVSLVASALRLGEGTEESLEEALANWLARRRTLLILDNCEHLVEAVSGFVERLVTGCPDLRIVATSREILGLRAERTLRVPPLGMSDASTTTGTADAVELDCGAQLSRLDQWRKRCRWKNPRAVASRP